jgi:hypothetical protein
MRAEADALVAEFLAKGGEIKKLPPQKYGKGRAKIFTKDAPRSARYDRDTSKYMSGRFLAPSKLQFTSRPVPENSSAKRQDDIVGAVVEINGELKSRDTIVADEADDIADAMNSATIRDDLAPDVDDEHRDRMKLAA